jgi:hypothetical protein
MFEVAGWSDPTGMSTADAASRFAELEHLRRQVDAALVAVVGEVQRAGLYRADGHASVSGWLRALGRWSNADVAQHRQIAELAEADDAFAAALAAGAVGVAQAVELGRAFANPRCGRELLDDLATFLDRADHVPHREFRNRVDTWTSVHDRQGAHDDADRSHAARTATITVSRGVVRGSFSGSGAAGAAMLEIFDRFRTAEFDADVQAATRAQASASDPLALARTDAQRRFDALAAIFERAAAVPADATAPDPLVNVVVDVHTLAELLEADPPLATRPDAWSRRCGTADGHPLAPADVLAAMWWGHTRAVVVDAHGVVVGVGRRQRLFRGRARDAALLLAERCVWPGCDLPAGRCQADHVVEHQHGGPTEIANAAPLCGRHNRFKSDRRYRLRRDPDGTWHAHRDDGTEIR